MFSNMLKIPFAMGVLSAYPIIVLIQLIVPDINIFIFSFVGFIFTAVALKFKISIGMFNRPIFKEKELGNYSFTVGTSIGFIFLGLVL